MNTKRFLIITAAALLFVSPLSKGQEYSLKIDLPQETTINENSITLGQLCKISGDESLVDKASKITLGLFSTPAQEITIERPVILSRLASNGIPSSLISFVGAEKTIAKQHHQVVKGNELAISAESYLKTLPSFNTVFQISPVQLPADLYVAGTDNKIKFTYHLLNGGTVSQAKVNVSVLVNDIEIANRDIMFRLKYNCRQAVTTTQLEPGMTIKESDIRIETVLSDSPEPADWKPPYNLIVKRKVPADTIIRPDMTDIRDNAILVKRNQSVLIRVNKPGLLVTAAGRTMQDGRVNEFIKVRNMDSQRVIVAKVNADGTVEPAL
jgi:flagellar basal body P-ring formation protein FlgA